MRADKSDPEEGTRNAKYKKLKSCNCQQRIFCCKPCQKENSGSDLKHKKNSIKWTEAITSGKTIV